MQTSFCILEATIPLLDLELKGLAWDFSGHLDRMMWNVPKYDTNRLESSFSLSIMPCNAAKPMNFLLHKEILPKSLQVMPHHPHNDYTRAFWVPKSLHGEVPYSLCSRYELFYPIFKDVEIWWQALTLMETPQGGVLAPLARSAKNATSKVHFTLNANANVKPKRVHR
jgi:hypothetical protein